MSDQRRTPARRSVKNPAVEHPPSTRQNFDAHPSQRGATPTRSGAAPRRGDVAPAQRGTASSQREAAPVHKDHELRAREHARSTSGSASSSAASSAASYKSAQPTRSPRSHLRIPQFIFLVLLLAIVITACLFGWDRWFRFSDHEDFHGTWMMTSFGSEAATVVTIDSKAMELAPDVHYTYHLNTWKKTITYTFDDLEGSGIYRFSADRNTLIILEGGIGNWFQDAKVALGLIPVGEGADPNKTTSLTRIASSLPPAADDADSAGSAGNTGDTSDTTAAGDNPESGND
ncbi:MAG: hypothetical protein FWG24_03065 [Eggerthellaceae bacterium]|nr:hypothetical protein [Eggerthellaceae bacterium]